MGDGLELKHRLPRVWELVVERKVPVHLARDIAQHTRHLTGDGAAYVDRLASAAPG